MKLTRPRKEIEKEWPFLSLSLQEGAAAVQTPFRDVSFGSEDRDYAVPGQVLGPGEYPPPAPTWPLSRTQFRSILALSRQPFDPDIAILDGGFHDASRAGDYKDSVHGPHVPDSNTLQLNSVYYSEHQLIPSLHSSWKELLYRCQLALGSRVYGKIAAKTLVGDIWTLHRKTPTLPRLVETVRTVEMIQVGVPPLRQVRLAAMESAAFRTSRGTGCGPVLWCLLADHSAGDPSLPVHRNLYSPVPHDLHCGSP